MSEVAEKLSYEDKKALDDEILEARGKNEPPITDKDIRSIEGLALLAGGYIKMTRDNGRTWEFGWLYEALCEFKGCEPGYKVDDEIMPNVDCRCRSSITAKSFESGLLVVRSATREEVAGIEFFPFPGAKRK